MELKGTDMGTAQKQRQRASDLWVLKRFSALTAFHLCQIRRLCQGPYGEEEKARTWERVVSSRCPRMDLI